MGKSEVKYGALLSYVSIFLNSIYGLIISPYILSTVGAGEYGVYKTISAFTVAFMVLDLGLGSTMMRYIAKFRADNEEKQVSNYVAMCFVQASILIVVLTGIMTAVYFSLDSIYSGGLSSAELHKAKQLYIFLAAGIVLHIVENVAHGVLTGYNRFILAKSLSIGRLILRIALIFVILIFIKNTLAVVLIDLFLTVLLTVVELLHIKFGLRLKVHLTKWDNKLFISSFKYTVLMLVTSIAAQVNTNLDNVVIGAIVGSVAVTVYSYGTLVFSMFEQLSTAISGVLLPTVTNILAKDDEQHSNAFKFIIKIGRAQFALLGAALIGFIVVGKRFINVWLGQGFEDIYTIVLILMVPALFELCVNACLSILRAKNMIGFRTAILLVTTILNAIITIVGTRIWNYYAAAIGTALSFLIGSVIIMNIYYYKKLKFNMFKVYFRIFKGIVPCLLISGIVCALVSHLIKSNLLGLVLSIVAFVVVYGVTLLLFGLNKDERQSLKIKGIKFGGIKND